MCLTNGNASCNSLPCVMRYAFISLRTTYSTDIDYHKIKYARPAFTSFAVQIVQDELINEAKKVAKPDGGLHTFTSSKGKVSRYDLGEQTFPEAMEIFKQKMPITRQYLLNLSVPSKENDERSRLPPEYVSILYFIAIKVHLLDG